MRVRASITLSKELLEVVDEYARQRKETRSAFIEAALRAFIDGRTRDVQNAGDLEIINQHADSLNREAIDVLGYSP
jgi:metal-responsive CopG/Arc/MetJ family transcriptional regulator